MTTQSNGNNLLVQGRLVWTLGNNLTAGKQKTDMQTKQIILGKDGQPVTEYGFGLAIPKLDPATNQPTEEYQKVWQALHAEAFTLYPSGQIPPGFAMKFKDGDTDVDESGKSYSSREGYAGHIVLACTTRIPIKYFMFQGGNNVLVNEGIKCGDYVNVQLNVKAHPAVGRGKAGLYVNPSAVQLIQPGKEIINAPSGDQIFGQNAPPSYNGQVVEPTKPQMPGAMVPQPETPAHYGVLPNVHQPQQQVPNMNAVPAPQMPGAMAPQPGIPGVPGNVPAPHVGQGHAPQLNGHVPNAYPSNVPPAPQMPGMPT